MKRIPALLLLSLYLTACAHLGILQKDRTDCPDSEAALLSWEYPSSSLKSPSDFSNAIKEIEARTNGTGPEAAQAHLDLSYLFSHQANSTPDYAKAQSSLERYIALSGAEAQPAHIQDRLALLRKMNDLLTSSEKDAEFIELMRQDNRTLMLEIQQLKNDVQKLQNENLEMKETMERLNQLEVQHEQKRKQIK